MNLVTGAAGFVGKELVRYLRSQGLAVRAMVRSESGTEDLQKLGAEIVIADLRDRSSLDAAVKGISTVYHIAALFRQANQPESAFHEVNVEGTRRILDAAVNAGVHRVIHCSTVGVHGHVVEPPATEESPFNPGDPYQNSKAEGEKLFLQYVRDGKIRGSVIRPAMIYGPHDSRTGKLFERIAAGKFVYVGSGRAMVHFVDVRDLARAFHLAAQRNDINGEVFIIAGETALPLNELVSIISGLLGVREPWLHLPVRAMQSLGSLCEAVCVPFGINPPLYRRRVDFFTKDRHFNCTKARTLLGFAPTKPLLGELIDIIQSYLEDGRIKHRASARRSTIVRSLGGKILLWDDSARRVYGWSPDRAIGCVSHELFRTKFPEDLSEINSRLERSGRWQGELLHRDASGNQLLVKSEWRVVRHIENEPLVLELNEPTSSEGKLACLAGFAATFLSPVGQALEPLLCM